MPDPEEPVATTETAPATEPAPTDDAPPVPFVEPVSPIMPPPSDAQSEWKLAHPEYVRISSSITGRFSERGTLYPDGTYIAGDPVMDGNGAFSVGIPY